jgi:hypothetical protein
MGGRLCKNILNDTFRQFAGALVLFLDNLDQSSRFNINPVSSTHLWLQPISHTIGASFLSSA